MADPAEPEAALRRDAWAVIRAALRAVDPEALVADALAREPLTVPPGGRLLVLGVGKAAPGMLRGAGGAPGHGVPGRGVPGRSAGGDPPCRVVAVVPEGLAGAVPDGVRVHVAGHPLPDEGGLAAATAVRESVVGLTSRDRLLLLLSGGGSALLTLPAEGVGLADLRAVTRALLEAGAPIEELNTVRKHLEVLKGGGLARLAAPALVRALVISDVVGDRLEVIASGPVSPDSTTFADAARVLRARGIWRGAPEAVRKRFENGMGGRVPETPGAADPLFRTVRASVVGNAARAVAAAAEEAESRGYAAERGSDAVEGEARDVGARLGREARELAGRGGPACRIAAGETTVTVTGTGRGGRNQEVALGAAESVRGLQGVLVFSVGTDGVDGPTDAAGAWVTGRTLDRAEARGLDPREALRRNDAYPFFETLDDLVVTGPTGTNVMDVMGILVGAPPEPP